MCCKLKKLNKIVHIGTINAQCKITYSKDKLMLQFKISFMSVFSATL